MIFLMSSANFLVSVAVMFIFQLPAMTVLRYLRFMFFCLLYVLSNGAKILIQGIRVIRMEEKCWLRPDIFLICTQTYSFIAELCVSVKSFDTFLGQNLRFFIAA